MARVVKGLRSMAMWMIDGVRGGTEESWLDSLEYRMGKGKGGRIEGGLDGRCSRRPGVEEAVSRQDRESLERVDVDCGQSWIVGIAHDMWVERRRRRQRRLDLAWWHMAMTTPLVPVQGGRLTGIRGLSPMQAQALCPQSIHSRRLHACTLCRTQVSPTKEVYAWKAMFIFGRRRRRTATDSEATTPLATGTMWPCGGERSSGPIVIPGVRHSVHVRGVPCLSIPLLICLAHPHKPVSAARTAVMRLALGPSEARTAGKTRRALLNS